jgi:hypothetical protein
MRMTFTLDFIGVGKGFNGTSAQKLNDGHHQLNVGASKPAPTG